MVSYVELFVILITLTWVEPDFIIDFEQQLGENGIVCLTKKIFFGTSLILPRFIDVHVSSKGQEKWAVIYSCAI